MQNSYFQQLFLVLAPGNQLQSLRRLMVEAHHYNFQITLYKDNCKMNKLDLIFEKEPPEVQRKLMNLLIQYNAMMQYNAKEDKFEVDLLLPFKTAEQKKEFIQNFKSRSNKKPASRDQKRRETIQKSVEIQEVKNNRSFQVQNKNFESFKPVNEPKNQQQPSQNELEPYSPQRQDQPQISYELTNENYDLSERRKTISIRDISSIIKDKLKQAIEIIKYENEHYKFPDSQIQLSSQRNQQDSKNSIKLNRVEMEMDAEKEGEDDGMILRAIDEHQGQTTNKKRRERQDEAWIGAVHEPEASHEGPRHRDASQHENQILIKDSNEAEGQEKEIPGQNQREFVELLEGSAIVPPINSKIFKNYLEASREELKRQKSEPQNYKEPQNVRQMKQKLADKYGSKKVNSTNIRQKYSQFLKKNHRDFDRIYETIRKQIRRNQTQLVKSRREDPILVLEQNLTDTHSEQDRIFKEQIIKDYQKHIIAQNENMSSEDLIRYFRYLLQNAKTLYVKNLRKGK